MIALTNVVRGSLCLVRKHVSVRLALQKITMNPRRFVMKFCVASAVAITALIAGLGGARAGENLQTLPTEISIAE
jgi:hypothetical protein